VRRAALLCCRRRHEEWGPELGSSLGQEGSPEHQHSYIRMGPWLNQIQVQAILRARSFLA
jgi:hypothetical protein